MLDKFGKIKILVMKFRNIGDVLLVTPLLKTLKKNYPNGQIDFALNNGTQPMIEENPNINEIIIYEREKIQKMGFLEKIGAEIDFAMKIKNGQYDIVINLTKGDRGAFLAFLSGAKIKIGYEGKNLFLKNIFNLKLPKLHNHTIETNLDAARVLNLPIDDKKVEIFWDKKDEIDLNINDEFIHIHPVSRWLFKCIDDKIMATIIDFCQNNLDKKVIITASPDQKELKKVESILSFCKSKPLNLSGKLSLKQTAALSKKSKLFIGVDTAIMHIAAANDIPVLAFFGPSTPSYWGPWDNNLFENGYIAKRGDQKMGKHRVLQADWDCVPCNKDGCNGSKISDCLMAKGLNVEIIKLNIQEMINDKYS